MGDSSSEFHRKLDDTAAVKLTGRIMVVGIVVLFFVVVFVLFLHLYAKWFWNRQDPQPSPPTTTTNQRRRRRRRFDFAPGHQELAANHRRGLDPSSLKALPVTVFDPKEFNDGLECAVCLSDLAAGEKARLLPECNHGFHLECIDMWFQSHSTCPLCRNPVANHQHSNSSEPTVESVNQPRTENHQQGGAESLSFPTNVLFWGNQVQVSTMGSSAMEEELHVPSTSFPPSPSSSSSSPSLSPSSTFGGGDRPDGFLIIDIPRQVSEEEEPKSPAVPTRLRSLKRLLTRDRRVNPSSSSSVVDVEQGRSQN